MQVIKNKKFGHARPGNQKISRFLPIMVVADES